MHSMSSSTSAALRRGVTILLGGHLLQAMHRIHNLFFRRGCNWGALVQSVLGGGSVAVDEAIVVHELGLRVVPRPVRLAKVNGG